MAFPGSDGALSKEDNIGAIIDRFLGLHYSGYYVTLNFIPSTVTTLFGVWAGLLMMRRHSHSHRVKVLAGAAAACFAGGLLMSLFNPMVKRLWTASFTLASAGWVFLMLLALYWLVEVKEYRKAVYPLVVVGVSSIFVYSMHMVLDGWFDRAVGVFTARYEFWERSPPWRRPRPFSRQCGWFATGSTAESSSSRSRVRIRPAT